MSSTTKALGPSLSVRSLAAVALVATVLARAVAPAVPGLRVGIERLIVASDFGSALLSQLAAAGGVAATCQLAVDALRARRLELGLRLVGLPASAIVVALVMAAWARPLEPQLCRALALAGVATASTAALSAFPDRDRRAGALVLALASGSALMHLFAREVALFEVSTPRVVHLSPLLATFAVVLDAGTLALTGVYLSERKSRRLALGGGGVLVLSLALSWLAHRGALPGAGAASVLAARALAQLSLAPRPALPELVRFMLLLGTLLVAALALGQRAERARNGTVMALCLLSLGAPDVPLPALWLVLAALLCPNFGTGLDTPAPALRASED